jgi:NTE family protein
VIRGEALARFVREHTAAICRSRLARPLGIVATDLDTGRRAVPARRHRHRGAGVQLGAGGLPAGAIGGREYVDGGLVSPVPVRYARQMGAELVLAVDISARPKAMPPATR